MRSTVAAGRDDWEGHWKEFEAAARVNPAQAYRRRLILELLAAEGPPARLVDIGSGTGDLAAALRRAFPAAEILGLELSRSGIEASRRKVPEARFLETDLLKAPHPPAEHRGWATHAVCSEVLEHVESPLGLLRNAGPYLAPGCRFVVTVPGGPMTAFDRHIGHRRHFRPAEVRSLLEAAGFDVDRATGVGFPVFNAYRLAVRLRGRQVVDDAVSGEASTSAVARGAMRIFDVLFRLQSTRLSRGWQIVATARRRSDR